MIISIPIAAKRWQILLRTIGYKSPFKECFSLILAAVPLTSITPSKSGDIIKAYYLKDKITASKTVGSILTERIFDVIMLISFSLIGMAFYQRFMFATITFGILFILIGLIFMLHTHIHLPIKESWNRKVQNIALSMKTLSKNKKALLSIIFYSFLLWFLAIVQTLVFFYALGIKVPLLFSMANIPIAIFIGMIPVTLGGMGTRDTAIILLFSAYATPYQLLGVGILFSLFRYWLLSLIGIPFMRMMLKQI